MSRHDPPLIAHVIYRLDIGGLENGLVNLVNGMPEGRYRHAIICIDRFTEYSRRLRRDDVELVSINKKPGRDPTAAWRLYRTFRRMKPDILHTRNLGALDALLPAFLAGVRHRVHGEHGWDASDHSASRLKNRLIRRIHAPLIGTYIALSLHIADYLTERIGIDRRRIVRISNGVDTDRFIPVDDRRSIRTAVYPMFDAGTRIIGTVCRLDPVKDPMNLIAAYSRLLQDAGEAARRTGLVLIGDGEMRHAVEREVRRLALGDRVWVSGYRGDVPELMQAMDVFVLPSLAEGISNTVLEAMASGLPVVATDVGGNAELVLHGETGTLVPPADPAALAAALRVYLRDEDLIARYGAAGRARAERDFGLDVMISKYTAVYDRILGDEY